MVIKCSKCGKDFKAEDGIEKVYCIYCETELNISYSDFSAVASVTSVPQELTNIEADSEEIAKYREMLADANDKLETYKNFRDG